jgi:tetratricopeptide (TPR) repeat protein
LLCVLAGAGCWEIARELGRRNWRSAAIRIGAALLLAILFSLHPPSCEERVNYRSEFYALLSRSAFNEENWEEAQELLETALEYDPRSHDAHYRLGRVLAAKRQTAQAIVHFNKALAGNVDPRAFAERCRAHLRLHLIEKAEADCAAALALTPKNVLALLHQGDLDLMKGDVASARLNWKQVLARGGATGKIAKHRLSRHPEGSERKTLKELRASPDATESD